MRTFRETTDMRCLLCCFLLLFMGSVLAQSDPPPSAGKNPRVYKGKWNPEGWNSVLNEDNEIWQEGLFRNGRLWDGTVLFFGEDGVLVELKKYRNGQSIGTAELPVPSDTLNQTDSLRCKQGYWIYYGKNRPDSGIPAEGKVEEGTYINDRKEGKWIKYHDDGIHPRIMGYYENNRPKGIYEKYYLSGQLKEKGNFDKNRYRDTLTRYREDGTIEYQAVYDSLGKEITVLHGDAQTSLPHTEYSIGCTFGSENRKPPADEKLNQSDENGKQGHWIYYGRDRPDSGIPADGKVEEGNYIDDRKEGTWIKYHDDGKTPKLIGVYANNRPRGHYARYNIDGSLRDSGDFSNVSRNIDSLRTGGYYDHDTFVAGYRSRETAGSPPDSLKLYPPQISATPNMGPRPKPFQPNGFNTIYNEDGEGWIEGTFKNGQLSDGKVYFYDSDGILLEIAIYRDGKYLRKGEL